MLQVIKNRITPQNSLEATCPGRVTTQGDLQPAGFDIVEVLFFFHGEMTWSHVSKIL